jgi:cytochrome b561
MATHWAALKSWELPSPSEDTPLASAVEGLGLLVASAMAATGAVLYATMSPDGALSGFGSAALNAHKLLANLMWAYLVGHALLAVLQETQGHDVLKRIFSMKKSTHEQ